MLHKPLLHSGPYFPFLLTPIAGALAPLNRASFYDSNSATYMWGHALYEEIRGLLDSCLHLRRGCNTSRPRMCHRSLESCLRGEYNAGRIVGNGPAVEEKRPNYAGNGQCSEGEGLCTWTMG